ncbi:hypothetical protein [Dawidia soli]|uniref:Uncharacterized protein n=1 Tax=Dawidia soli TaxID=2782352 RepID=A0AAP2DEU2_9BACT|nr:hypothetical protein [Dawidia soli]MBT1689475.1 hypothetical protein [Dawidia soli]
MPFLEGPFAFTGKLDMLSAYRMRGVDKIVVRRKGGPSREKIKTSPSFENTRHTMSEFGGCSRLGSYVRLAMHSIRQLSDYNFGSDINSVMRLVQLRDDTGEWGRRKIILSEHARILEGFQTTKKAPSFDSIVRTPVYYTLDRANRSARVEIPELLRDINYFPQNNHAMFRLTITLGIVPDIRYDIAKKQYLPAKWYDQACYAKTASTDWNPSLEGMGNTTLELAMNVLPPEDGWTLMLAIGIQYGVFRENGKIDEVKRFGAAKILALRGKDGAPEDGGDGAGKDSMDTVDDVVTEDAPAPENEPQPETHREPGIRYVYTTNKTVAVRPEATAYHYAMSYPVEDVAPAGDARPANREPYSPVGKVSAPVYSAGIDINLSPGCAISRVATYPVRGYTNTGKWYLQNGILLRQNRGAYPAAYKKPECSQDEKEFGVLRIIASLDQANRKEKNRRTKGDRKTQVDQYCKSFHSCKPKVIN